MHLGYADGDLFGLGEDGGADKKLDRLREKAQLMPVLKRAQTAQRQLNTFVVIPVDISVEFLNKSSRETPDHERP